MARPHAQDRLEAAEKRMLQTSRANLRIIIALLAFVGVIACFETPLYGILLWITEMYRRGSIEKDWWKCLVYDANVLEHYIDSQDALKLVGALATSIFQALLCALLAVVLVQRASIRIDWVSSAIVNSLFLGLNILLPNLNPSFLAPNGIQSSLVILDTYVRPEMFDRIPKPNKCHKAYQFAKLVMDVEYAAVFCTAICVLLAIRLAVRRRLAIRALRHVRILLTTKHNAESDTMHSHLLERSDLQRTSLFVNSECGSVLNDAAATVAEVSGQEQQAVDHSEEYLEAGKMGGDVQQYVSVIPLRIAAAGLAVGFVLVVSYLADVFALTRMAIISQRSADHLPDILTNGNYGPGILSEHLNSNAEHAVMSKVMDRLKNGFVLYVSAKSSFSLSSLVFFIFSLFLRGVAGDDLAPVRLAAIFTAALFIYSAPMYAAHVHDVVMYDLWYPSKESCFKYLTDGGYGAQVFYFPQGDDVLPICSTIAVHFWAVGFHVLAILGLLIICVLAFALNPGVRLISPSPHIVDGTDGIASEHGGPPHMFSSHDTAGFEYDIRGPPGRHVDFLRDPTLARYGQHTDAYSDVGQQRRPTGPTGRRSFRRRQATRSASNLQNVPERDNNNVAFDDSFTDGARSDSQESTFSYTESCPAGLQETQARLPIN